MSHDPQNDVDIPQKYLDQADALVQENILTSVDEERYCSGDMDEEIEEKAAELWAEAIENEKIARAEHQIEQDKERARPGY